MSSWRRQKSNAGPVAVAGNARLDVVLVAESEASALGHLATAAVPVDWALTSGSVEPQCCDGALRAVLGTAAGDEPVRREPSAISQVVAVSGGCRYAFSFWGVADQPASIGEILWRAGDCGLARADRVPIAEADPTVSNDTQACPHPVLQRAMFEAPAGTSQAEVRFTVPTGGHAMVGPVSLRGSDLLGANPDFSQRTDDGFEGWAPDPAGGALSIPAGRAGAAQVRNDSATPGALVQAIAVGAGPLVIELAGRVTAEGDDPGPRWSCAYSTRPEPRSATPCPHRCPSTSSTGCSCPPTCRPASRRRSCDSRCHLAR